MKATEKQKNKHKKQKTQIKEKNIKKKEKKLEQNNNKFSKIMEIFIASSEFLLLYITVVLILTNLLFVVKISITALNLPIAFLISTIIFMIAKKEYLKQATISIIVGLLIFSLSALAVGQIYDSTADGNTYHKLAIGAMKSGWNPVYSSVADFNKDEGNPFDIYEDNVNVNWVDHYAKGTETFAAVVYSFTGNIETGKVFNLLWIYIGFFIFYKLFKILKLSNVKSIIVSCILAFNPISLVQINNLYLDGVLAISLFIIILICIIQKEKFDKKTTNELYAILFCTLIWAINTKFNGLAYSGVFCAVFYIYKQIANYLVMKKEFIKPLIKETIFYILTVFVAVAIVGAGSYTKNMIEHGNPLYPLYGKGHIPSMIMQEIPKSMNKYSPLKQFLVSTFAKSENVSPSYSDYVNEPELKLPVTTSKEEILNFSVPDIRMGGFGPMFSAIFILSIISLFFILYKAFRKKEWNEFMPLLLVSVTSFILICLIDGSYWARYIPYVYLIPVLVLSYCFRKEKPTTIKRILIVFILILYGINSGLVMLAQIKSTCENKKYIDYRKNLFIDYASKNKKVKIHLAHHGAQGVQYNLDDWKIKNYELTEDETLSNDCYMFKY